ncbi:MAG: nucleoside triphosphate pyrophosphohydrolase [Pseudomonadota bacterium]
MTTSPTPVTIQPTQVSDDPAMNPNAEPMARLLTIMARLRGPQGCPWDREQDFASIAPYTIEEAYEVADAINRNNLQDLKEELGDLLLQVVFHSQMAAEQEAFTFADVAQQIADKMVSRHPHVFGAVDATDSDAVKEIWEQQKDAEKAAKTDNAAPPAATSVLDDVPLNLPALMRAQKISKRAARIGFEWPDLAAVFDKLEEERDELQEAVTMNADGAHHHLVHEEFGDLMFVAVNIARHLKIDAEQALKDANLKFEKRFKTIEQDVASHGKTIHEATMDEMQSAWEAAKRGEKSG